MTQNEKELLLSDLSARLAYGVKFHYKRWRDTQFDEDVDGVMTGIDKTLFCCSTDEIAELSLTRVKPYLRPMSSMTEDEKNELHNNSEEKWANALDFSLSPVSAGESSVELESIAEAADIDWLYSHHFDFRDLIKKGLALEAPEDMYKTDDYDKEE